MGKRFGKQPLAQARKYIAKMRDQWFCSKSSEFTNRNFADMEEKHTANL